MQHSLTILTCGRNDNYDGNFNERLIIAMNQNMQRLPECKFVFVEWNPIPDKRLVCEDLQVAFGDRVKYYVVHPNFHSAYCLIDDFLEYPAKNVVIRRATTDFILSINSDVIISPEVTEKLKGSLKRNTVYRAVRLDIRPDYLQVKFPILPKFIVGENRGTLNACGDFLLMDKDSWHQSTGYMENCPEQRLHKDSEFVYRVSEIGKKPIEFLGSITHWRHKSSWSNSNQNRPKVGDINWNYKKLNYLKNQDNWGLIDAKEENRKGITWLVPKEKEPVIEVPLKQSSKPSKKKILVCGAGGFIGGHLVTYLKEKEFWVRGVDLKYPEYKKSDADEFRILDLRHLENCREAIDDVNIVYQLAADMGGAGCIFTKEHDADIMHNSAIINLHMAKLSIKHNIEKIFYSSSACIYPDYNQIDPDSPDCSEESAYPANPDSMYGWEKLFSENLYLSYHRNYGLPVRIARFHNIFGEYGSWNNGKEKSPAALCRKVAETSLGDTIEIWGPGTQTRSFLYIEECLEGIDRLMRSDWTGPVNIGSSEMISINNLAKLIMNIGNKNLQIKNIPGPLGVMGRNSDNTLIHEKLGWTPKKPLRYGMEKLYNWINFQLTKLQ